ncbi:S8 family serine peptidase [Shewanella livingstonensis]|uniref:S8 family serine peptidase n=1 Tax=Shewanella livingstonensis TaxID=150120 RepID=UPI001FC97410|nr:S8 family serine peptidase [Shewanella livingstonensis]
MTAYSLALLSLTLVPLMSFGQLLPVPTLPSAVIDKLDQSVSRNAERLQALKQQRLLNQQLQQTLTLKATLLDPLLQLPAVVPVLNSAGLLVWNDIEVENGLRAVEREWLLLLSIAQWQQLLTTTPELEIYVQSRTELAMLGLQLVKIQVPVELDSVDALRKTLSTLLAPYLSRNYIYQPQAANQASTVTDVQASTETATQAGRATTDQITAVQQVVKSETAAAMCDNPIRLGMIDTAIVADHKALPIAKKRLALIQRNFLASDIPSSYSHGTAVAGVLAGNNDQLKPLLPSLTLYSAGAFYAQNTYQQGATLDSILQALNWLVGQQVRVINMSLTGPDNPILQEVVSRLSKTQTILVAAAGNGGPAAKPLYPAAYSDVIAVTAVDKQLGLYRWANQGDYIDFAAQGVKVLTTRADGSVGIESGTSMATPVVSAKVACMLAATPELLLDQVLLQLQQQVIDLGAQGKDPQFGYGLVSRP